MAASYAAQFVVDDWQQFLARSLVAPSPCGQQLRDVV
jgi:hypothetical protein